MAHLLVQMLVLNNIFVENKVVLPDVENLQEIGS
jgi:hypothetical protein